MPNTTYLALPYPGLSDAPNGPSQMQALAQTLDAFGSPWSAYTPVWTATGTAPSLGNGTLTGRYKTFGKTMWYSIMLTAGSTTTYGTLFWSFSIPATAAAASDYLGTALAEQGATTAVGAAKVVAGTATVTRIYFAAAAGPTVPFTWANGNKLTITGTCELA